MLRFACAVLFVAAFALPPSASADTIVHLRGGDVFLTGEQGTLRLTTDGGYESPSQADDGTIVAVRRVRLERDGVTRNVRLLHRLDPTGRLLNAPTEAVPTNNSQYTGPLGVRVSPDGRIAAYHYFNTTGLVPRPELPRLSMAYTDRDTAREEIVEEGYYLNPTWVGPRTVAIFGTPGFTPNVQLYTVGGAIQDWFSDPNGAYLSSGDLSRDGGRFAATAEGASEIRLYAMSGPPPAAPQPKCMISRPNATYQRPTWSPDGRGLAWSEPDGIHVADVASLEDCGSIREQLVAPGAESPDWGPANLRLTSSPSVKTRGRSVTVAVSCARRCSVKARLTKRGRTISSASRRLARPGTVRLRLAKRGRNGVATLAVTVGQKTHRRQVRL